MSKIEVKSNFDSKSLLEMGRVKGHVGYYDGMSPLCRCLKRFFDVLGSLLGMIVFSPFYLIISLMIWMEDHGPVLFRQERVGYGGQIFVLYKFRSMTITAEADGKPALCQKRDARLTKVGRFLREHHLDELPQLWNVLKGDMSFVGPRPERQYFVDQIKAYYFASSPHRTRTLSTGLWCGEYVPVSPKQADDNTISSMELCQRGNGYAIRCVRE